MQQVMPSKLESSANDICHVLKGNNVLLSFLLLRFSGREFLDTPFGPDGLVRGQMGIERRCKMFGSAVLLLVWLRDGRLGLFVYKMDLL